MNQLIEHMVDPVPAMEKLARILTRGGMVFIETPDINALNARLAPARYYGGDHTPRHLCLFSQESITLALEGVGLEVHQIRHVTSLSYGPETRGRGRTVSQ